MGAFFSWIQSLFWAQEMEIAVLGLQNAGKSTFVSVINTGTYDEKSMMPTIGFQMSKVQKGKVTIKIWDMGGQKKFRGMWERYCRGVEVIVFVVDASDFKTFPTCKKELKSLLAKGSVTSVPLLVLFNKNDLQTVVQPDVIVKELDLGSIRDRDVAYFSTSCKDLTNIDKSLEWVINHNKQNRKKTTTTEEKQPV